ncbi:MAG: VWA domain-containing protein [Gammaproteobacteria bacterium]
MSAILGNWTFAWPWLLLALPLPWLAVRLLPATRPGLDAALRIPFGDELRALQGPAPGAPRARWSVLAMVAWALLCMAAARPQQLGAVVQPPQTGRDLLLAVDLSGSMGTEDMVLGQSAVDRLTAVKAVLGDFLDRRVGDRVGLLLFGAQAYAVTPLTRDRDAVRQQLEDSEVGMAGSETAIGDAIALAVKRLLQNADQKRGPDDGQRVLILLTDGVNTAGAITPDQATQLAVAAKLRVYTIGFGGENQETGFFGLRIARPSEIDEAALRAIATRTGGRYFRARDAGELAGIYAELDRIEPAARPGEVQRPRVERYPVPLLLALVIALPGFLRRHVRFGSRLNSGLGR